MQRITSPAGNPYDIIGIIGKTGSESVDFRVYQCTDAEGRDCILKIGVDNTKNGILDREAFLFSEMTEGAAALEEAFEKVKDAGTWKLNYQRLFPAVVESFIDPEQDGRRINILSLRGAAEKLVDLIPISQFRTKEHVRVDPRTSAWIMGRLLKFLLFTHTQRVSTLDILTGQNILVNKDKHRIAVFDWSAAAFAGDTFPEDAAAEEIAAMANHVILALGGDPDTGQLPEDEQLADNRYQGFLWNLACKNESDVEKVHREFYELIRDLWPRGFYPFRTIALK